VARKVFLFYRSMLKYISANNIPHKQINLIFGTRTHADLLYADEMKALEKTLPDFHYYYTLSREQWDGHMGYVHPVYEHLCAAKQPATFMLCGWKAMIDEAKQHILAMGYDKKDVHSELYG
jgi:ferredoxin-NADP reductase